MHGQNIYLLDKELGTCTNLSRDSYRFFSNSGEYNWRFQIVYIPHLNISKTNDSNEIKIAKVDNEIVINSSIDKLTDVEVYDMYSRLLYKKSDVNAENFNINTLNFEKQIVVVKIKTETGEIVNKKFVFK